MRADRLVSLVLLLRRGRRMTAGELARELEVSERTILRDIEALSASGVPVYADRGRHGGFSLLPGFRTELTGLTHDEALALLTATGASAPSRDVGLGPALASAVRKVLEAVPDEHQVRADRSASRILLEPGQDLLSRPTGNEDVAPGVAEAVRRAVTEGRRLRVSYTSPGREARWHVLEPLGIVTVRGRGYLLATKDGADRTYRLDRMDAVEVQPEPATRGSDVDLAQLWAERAARFLADVRLSATVRVRRDRREDLLDAVRAVHDEHDEGEWLRLEVSFEDLRHAAWAVWSLGSAGEAVEPPELRLELRRRAEEMARRHA